MRALFTLADISGWALIHWLTRHPPRYPHMPPAVLFIPSNLLLASQINMDIQKKNPHTCTRTHSIILLFSCLSSFPSHLNYLHNSHAHDTRRIHTKRHTNTHTCTQYPVLEMHGGRLLRRGKPSVNDSSCGKIMFLMQRWVRRWWRKMTFWMVKWVNVRSQPQRFPFPWPTINPSFFLFLSRLLCFPSLSVY